LTAYGVSCRAGAKGVRASTEGGLAPETWFPRSPAVRGRRLGDFWSEGAAV